MTKEYRCLYCKSVIDREVYPRTNFCRSVCRTKMYNHNKKNNEDLHE